ncbi:MAG: VWA domain-containing protein [Clostridia bacterium]|nr:VWA domain-containing protein [Clostridia bacterium]
MNKNLTELVFILDRSGSMSGLEDDTIGGYNGLLEKQKKVDGEARVTTVLFDDGYEVLHDHADITKVESITDREYFARGSTALLDAIGKTISTVGKRHKYAPDSEIPQKTMVVIITDGHENASREYRLQEIKAMVERQQQKYGWEFLFLGANMDAISTASSFGISADRAATYCPTSSGTRANFKAVESVCYSVRAGKSVDTNWKNDIESPRFFKRR